jgi:hypothetical protein
MASTARSQYVAAVMALLNTYKSSNPTLLRAVYTSRPASIGETPVAFIGPRNEQIEHSMSVQTRTFVGLTLVLVDVITDNQESADRMDDLVDAIVDVIASNPRAVPSLGVLAATGVEDVELDYGTTVYRASVINLSGTFAKEGLD